MPWVLGCENPYISPGATPNAHPPTLRMYEWINAFALMCKLTFTLFAMRRSCLE